VDAAFTQSGGAASTFSGTGSFVDNVNITGGNSGQLLITSGNVAWDAAIDLDTGDTNGQWRIRAEGSDETFHISNIDQGGTSAFTLHPTTKNATFATQAFATTATSSGDVSSTLTTKGYVDSLITGATIYRGAWDPSGGGYGSPDLSGVTQTSGYYYICSAAGTAEPNGTGTEPNTWAVGDWVIYNDVSGTGQWQKIDNSSVLSGVGTGQTVALWEGAGSVTDSETLGNAPITVSGNNTTFAGTITGTRGFFNSGTANVVSTFTSTDTTATLQCIDSGGNVEFGASGNNFVVQPAGGLAQLTVGATSSTFAGNVLINKAANPTSLQIGSNLTDDPFIVFQTDGNTMSMGIDRGDSNKFKISDNATLGSNDRLTIDTSGNVGIGQTTPLNSLDIYRATGDASIRIQANTAADSTILKFRNNNADAHITVDYTTSNQSRMVFTTDNSGGFVPVLSLEANRDTLMYGNVGIGVTDPDAQLEIVNSLGGSTRLGYLGGSDSYFDSENFYVRSGNGNTNKFIINSSGNVGIGTTNPIGKFNVSKDSTTDGLSQAITVSSSSVSTKRMNLGYVPGSNYAFIDVLNYGVSNTNQALSLQPNGGNVGIGTTSPNAKLQIDNQGEGEFAGPNSSAAGSSHILLTDVGGTTRTLMSGPSIVFQTPAAADGTNIWATSRLLGSPAAAGSARGTFSIQVRDNYDPFNDGTSWNWRTALTAINTGNVGIGTNSPATKLQVAGGIQMADDTATASADKVGTLKYRVSGNNSYVDMCMQTGATTYAWINIVQNNW
jgi:hypothetical protein